MRLFVGLGNPGAKYARNRHNVGFMAMDAIATEHGFSPWRRKFDGQVSEGRLGDEKIVLLKPETFMNNSGQSVGKALRFFKLPPASMIVFHDEIDLAPGKCRTKDGGGHAGHNGLRSLHQHIGPDYGRVRIGVGHPGHKDKVAAFVLHDFARADQDWLDNVIGGISDGAASLALGDPGRFMNAVALRVLPARPAKKPKTGASGTKQGTEPGTRQGAKPPEPATEPTDSRGPLQKLLDRFR